MSLVTNFNELQDLTFSTTSEYEFFIKNNETNLQIYVISLMILHLKILQLYIINNNNRHV